MAREKGCSLRPVNSVLDISGISSRSIFAIILISLTKHIIWSDLAYQLTVHIIECSEKIPDLGFPQIPKRALKLGGKIMTCMPLLCLASSELCAACHSLLKDTANIPLQISHLGSGFVNVLYSSVVLQGTQR